jgi:tetratricopeptide (TPR) repeat protein
VLAVPGDSLLAAYNIEKDSLFPREFDQARTDVAVWLRMPDFTYRREFALNKAGYPGDSTWQEAKRAIYKRVRYREFRAMQSAVFAKYQREFPVTILDTNWHIKVEPVTKEALLANAAKNTEAQDFKAASEDWLRIRALFPEDDALQKTATDSLAGLYQVLERFADAETEYRALYAMWPNDKDAYKALFMRGFIYFENLKKNDKALAVFEELVQKFPDCDLADDAKILVDNIKSGGKYFEDLQKKIDSTAAADSAKAATTPPVNAP